jgi:hypothetical protein
MPQVARIAWVVLAVLGPTQAWACRPLPAPLQREQNIDYAERERAFVADVIDKADVIFEGRLLRSDRPNEKAAFGTTWQGADFAVERVLKGSATATLSVQWREGTPEEPEAPPAAPTGPDADSNAVLEVIHVSCNWPRDDFDEVHLRPGFRYLVYVKAGRVLRAREFAEGPPPLTAEQEAQLVPPPPTDD